MKTIRIFAIAIALVMMLSAAACGSSTPASSSTPPSSSQGGSTPAAPQTPQAQTSPAATPEPTAPITTAADLGLFFNPNPDRISVDPNIFSTIHAYIIRLDGNWSGGTSLALSDITDFTVYVDGTPNKLTLNELNDFGAERRISHHENRLDQLPAIYTFSFKIHGVELAQEMLPALSVSADGTYVITEAGQAIPQPSTDGTRPTTPAPSTPAPTTPTPSAPASGAITFLDKNFEAAVREHIGKPQGDITRSDAANVVFLNVSERGITNLSGIEHFTALGTFIARDNQITSINVSGLTKLEALEISGNQLTSLDVSGLTLLKNLECNRNQLTSLNVSGAVALDYLACAGNKLTTLDVSGLAALEYLHCYDNQLTSLRFGGNSKLASLTIRQNQLTSVDLTSLTALTRINMDNNVTATGLDRSRTNVTHGSDDATGWDGNLG